MINRIEKWVAIGAGTALVLLVVVVVVDVVGRSVFNSPLASGTELTELLMAAMAFLCFPLLTYRQRDITVDLFDFLGGQGMQKIIALMTGIVGAIVFALLSWQAFVYSGRAALSGEATPQLHFPLSWVWNSIGVMSAATALAALCIAVAAFTRHPVEPYRAPGVGT